MSPKSSILLLLLLVAGASGQVLHHVRTVFGTAGTGAGTIVAGAGDLDRDGCDDVIVGAPFTDTALGNDVGRARVYSGRTGALLYTLDGPQPGAKFGRAVAAAGDVDGDGFPDFVVGWNLEDTFEFGGVFVYSGSNGAQLGSFTAFSAFGSAVSPLGDVDGDGRDEFLVGVPLFSSFAAFQGGRVHVMRLHPTNGLEVVMDVDGLNALSRFGHALAAAGDANGDGVPDFVVGEPEVDVFGATNGGRVYLISGASGAVLQARNGIAANQRLGTVVAGGGDVNGDGVPDFGAGSTGGFARIFSGSNGTTLHSFQPIFGGAQGLGRGLAILNDVNGDGCADFAIGLPESDIGATDSGRVIVYSGCDGAVIDSVFGQSAGDQLGEVIAAADIDGDGKKDLIIGAPFADSGAFPFINVDAGAVSTFAFGEQLVLVAAAANCSASRVAGVGDVNGDGVADYATGSPCGVFQTQEGEYVRIYSGATHQQLHSIFYFHIMGLFGHDLDGVGDVNGDGFGDVVVGNPGIAGGSIDHGEVRVYSGQTGQLIPALTRTGGGSDRLGFAVAGLGDVNGDGVPDFAMGSPGWDRLTLSITGVLTLQPDAGKVEIVSGANGAILRTIVGTSTGARMGSSVSRAGDVNGDGVPDLLVGLPGQDTTVTDGGRFEVRSGANGALIHAVDGTVTGESLGTDVALAGDVNGDGVPDAIVGAPLWGSAFATGRGRALVVSGANGVILRTISGPNTGDHLGEAVAGAGDVDGDGRADLLVGLPDADGAGQLSRGAARVHSGATGALLAEYFGALQDDRFGSSVAGPGDLDGDCRGDVLVGMSNLGSAISGPEAFVFLSGALLGVESYGIGSPGCDGAICLGASTSPVLGATAFELICNDVPVVATGFLLLGPAAARVDAGADPFGIGLTLHLDALGSTLSVTPVVSNATGSFRLPAPIPNIASLAGFQFELQAIWYFGPCLATGFGFGSSNGLELTLLP